MCRDGCWEAADRGTTSQCCDKDFQHETNDHRDMKTDHNLLSAQFEQVTFFKLKPI